MSRDPCVVSVVRRWPRTLAARGRSHRNVRAPAVARWIEQATNDALAIGEGTLYPALHRLEERGWIIASWGASENNRQAKFYSLTRKGRTQLRAETASWQRYAAAVFAALDAPAVD